MEASIFIYTIFWNITIAIWIIVAVFIASLIKRSLNNYLEFITAITVWLLLGIIFIWFLPELTENKNLIWKQLGFFLLMGLLLFYLLELFLHWHHCKDLSHESQCNHSHSHDHKSSFLMFGWTMLHNSFHWIVLFSAFSINLHFWITTTLAVLLHSIPQNVVNYIMNHNNMKYVYIAAFWWIFGWILTYFFSNLLITNKFYILAIITWWLLYTALADIFPEFKEKWELKQKLLYLLFMVAGIFLFIGLESLLPHS